MTELASFILERLCGDGEFVLFRGKRDSDLAQVLVVAPALEQPVPETIARLQHAYSLAGQLDPAWAVDPWSWCITKGGQRFWWRIRAAILWNEFSASPWSRRNSFA